ncbi:fimbrial protein [Pseudomonas sp. D47]|uniref:fimbrial protein n=1 Tax=Pseudomonas sp. D47 TaxID=3159447 RepID=UPI00387B3A66
MIVKVLIGWLFLVSLFWASQVRASCEQVYNGVQASGGSSAQITVGRINLTSTHLQPVGSSLGSALVSAASAPGLSAETVLWQCDLKDKNQIFELFATNGADRVGGHWEIGDGAGTSVNDGLPGYFATYFGYVAIKLTHLSSGKTFTRYWQESPIRQFDVSGEKIQIKAKHLSMVQAELARVSTLPPASGSSSDQCAGIARELGSGVAAYTCMVPSAYVQFKGPGITSDQAGSDANTNRTFVGARNGVAFGLRSGASISYNAACTVRSVTPVVTFGRVTAQELNTGQTRESDFSIELECDDLALNTATAQSLFGIQVAPSAYEQAKKLGLVTSDGAVTYLLSTGYGSDSSIATGVGIRLRHNATGSAMNFVGESVTPVGLAGSRGAGGWYPIRDGDLISGTGTGASIYAQSITAILSALPGMRARSGKVDAMAIVRVRVQ